MYAQLDATVCPPRNPQMLDTVSQLLGIHNVGQRDLSNAFGIGLIKLQWDTKSDGREDSELVCGIDPFDIQSWIRFGVAETLRVSKNLIERPPLVTHLGKNEISRAVDDSCQPLDAVPGQPFADCLDNRYAATNCRLEGYRDTLLLGCRKNLITVYGNHCLISRDDMFSRSDGLQHELAGRMVTANELDNDIYIRVAYYLYRILYQGDVINGAGPRFAEIAHRRLDHPDRSSGAPCNLLTISQQHVDGTAANGA